MQMAKRPELKLHIGGGNLIPPNPPADKRITDESIERMVKLIREAEKLEEEEKLASK